MWEVSPLLTRSLGQFVRVRKKEAGKLHRTRQVRAVATWQKGATNLPGFCDWARRFHTGFSSAGPSKAKYPEANTPLVLSRWFVGIWKEGCLEYLSTCARLPRGHEPGRQECDAHRPQRCLAETEKRPPPPVTHESILSPYARCTFFQDRLKGSHQEETPLCGSPDFDTNRHGIEFQWRTASKVGGGHDFAPTFDALQAGVKKGMDFRALGKNRLGIPPTGIQFGDGPWFPCSFPGCIRPSRELRSGNIGVLWLKIEGSGVDGFYSIYQGHLCFQKNTSSPELVPLFNFCFFGVPLFSTHQAFVFAWGPKTQPRPMGGSHRRLRSQPGGAAGARSAGGPALPGYAGGLGVPGAQSERASRASSVASGCVPRFWGRTKKRFFFFFFGFFFFSPSALYCSFF